MPVWGVDFDKCCDAVNGKFSPDTRQVVIDLDSYGDYSPSGTGCHVLGIGKLPVEPGNKAEVLIRLYPGCNGAEVCTGSPFKHLIIFSLMAQGRNGVPDVPGAVSWLPEAARSHDIQRLLQPLVPASWQKLCFASTKSRNAEEFGTKPFFEGEVAPCINGGALAIGAYFRHPTESLARRLVCEQLDGGWNCETPKSTRSSFHTTICVLEGLLEYERAVGSAPEITAARGRGEEYLLKRALLRRLSTGEVANPAFLKFAYPPRYHYDVLRALDYFRLAGVPPDVRFDDAFQVIDSRCQADGRWLLDEAHDEALALPFSESMGQPSRWNTLRALRVLRWSGRRMS